MKALIKIPFFILAIFSTNFSEVKVVVFYLASPEIESIDYDVNGKGESIQISEKYFGLSCKNESNIIVYRNLVLASKAKAAKGVTNLIPEGKIANHLFKGAGKLADTPANRRLIQKISNGKPLRVDQYGKAWYAGVDGAGKPIYSYTKN